MNQQNKQHKSPSSGPEMQQLTFLTVILAVLLVVVIGGFLLVTLVIVPMIDQNNTPPIVDVPGSNFTEDVTGEQTTPPDEKTGFFGSIWAGILDLFKPAQVPQDETEKDPWGDLDPTYPFAGNTLEGAALPTGNGAAVADSTSAAIIGTGRKLFCLSMPT